MRMKEDVVPLRSIIQSSYHIALLIIAFMRHWHSSHDRVVCIRLTLAREFGLQFKTFPRSHLPPKKKKENSCEEI